ncbi:MULTISPECIES: SRPBCC domain-containing protein [Glutamicibacter]|nr:MULTISPECIES: SRPBCC domain-containing protein [Glutamicibacter]MBF6673138.1 SRPBCC domain-containing protein [Glutamicibacter sp. FBE19]
MESMTELVIARQFSAPKTAVWAAFVEPEIIAQWWGPQGWAVNEESVVFEAKVGGRHELEMVQIENPEAKVPLKAVLTSFDEYECLVSADGPHEMTLDLVIETRIEFKEFAGQTMLTLTQGPLPYEVVDSSTKAWHSALGKLEALLAEYF